MKFDNYLDDLEVYLKLEKDFFDAFSSYLSELNLPKSDWDAPYYVTNFSDGTPFQDANPLFSACHKSTHSIIRVVLEEHCHELSDWYQSKEEGSEYVICGGLPVLDKIKDKMKDWLFATTSYTHNDRQLNQA